MGDDGNNSARDRTCLRTDGILSRHLMPPRIVAFKKRQSPDQQPEQANNEGDECESCDNPQIDQCDTCQPHNMLDHRLSIGQTGDARFELGHLIALDKWDVDRIPSQSLS
jgi:hypothetical protein